MTRSTSRMRNLADFAAAMSRLEDWLRQHAAALKAPEDARSWAAKHLVEHGNVWDDPSRTLCACAHCGTTFTVPAGQPTAACPQCGNHAAPLPHGGEPPTGRICGCVRAWGHCGYRSDCKVCGVSAVLFDLELALADRSSRSHTLDLVHHLTKASEAHERAESNYERARVSRTFQQSLPAAVDAFLHGEARHREESIQRVRSQVEAIQRRGLPEGTQLRGQSAADLEALFPMISPGEVVARILESDPAAGPDTWRGSMLGLVNARESSRRAHVDPDRSLLGGLQDHLRAHGFSYGEIAHLLPDGEGGTQQQLRDRVKNRLQHRRRER
jgi:hypothetical protein